MYRKWFGRPSGYVSQHLLRRHSKKIRYVLEWRVRLASKYSWNLIPLRQWSLKNFLLPEICISNKRKYQWVCYLSPTWAPQPALVVFASPRLQDIMASRHGYLGSGTDHQSHRWKLLLRYCIQNLSKHCPWEQIAPTSLELSLARWSLARCTQRL